MRRSPVVLLVALALALLAPVACGDDGDDGDDAGPTTTQAATSTTDEELRQLSLCAPLLAISSTFDQLDVATGSEEGRVAADATLTTALDQIEELEPEPSPEVTQAISTLREVGFEGDDAPTGPPPEETAAAVATLTAELGGPCEGAAAGEG